MDSSSDQPTEAPKWRRWALSSIFVVALIVGGWAARRAVFSLAKDESLRVVRSISDSLPESQSPGGDPTDDLLFPLWPFDSMPPSEAVAADAEEGAAVDLEAEASGKKPKGTKGKKWRPPETSPVGPTPQNARATIERVLQWAAQELVPRGITRAAEEGMPAGIELYGVSPLGVGLLDGDRLVTVDGVSVLERAQVVGAALGARSRRAASMTAGLVRRTKEGPVAFSVVVEQPYPEHIPDSAAQGAVVAPEVSPEVLPELGEDGEEEPPPP